MRKIKLLDEEKKLFNLDKTGKTTHLNGEKIPDGLIRILSETERYIPPKETSWVVSAAYKFAKSLCRKSP